MTSDLHFGHANIIAYSDRPFYSLADMTATHLRLLHKVPADELLIFVGDMAMGDYAHGAYNINPQPVGCLLVGVQATDRCSSMSLRSVAFSTAA